MCLRRFALIFFGCLLAATAHAYIDPPILLPSDPTDADELVVELTLGICDAVHDGPDEVDIFVEDSIITLLIDGVRQTDPILCFFPPAVTHHYPIGAYPVGEYTLEVLFRHQPFGLPQQIDNIGTIEFSITGSPPSPAALPVPSTSPMGLFLLLIGMLLVLRFKRAALLPGLLVAAIFSEPSTTMAQPVPPVEEPPRLFVLFKQQAGAPTPEDVVEKWDFSNPAPTAGLSVGNPTQGSYLLPVRADGDFKTRIANNPEAARAELERYVVIEYPSQSDRNSAKAALQIDPNVAGYEHETERQAYSFMATWWDAFE